MSALIDTLTKSPFRIVLAIAGVLAVCVTGAALLVGGPALATAAISAAFLGVGLAVCRSGPVLRDMGAGAALIGQAIALTAAFQGHPWQIDAHMLFFALLACLIILRSIPAILMATVITALHHLSLSVFMPALVYPAGAPLIENLGRTVFHAVIVLMETAVLIMTVLILTRLERQTRIRSQELEDMVAHSDAARKEAEGAREAAEALQTEAQAARAQTERLLEDAKEAEARRTRAEQDRDAVQARLTQQQSKEAQEQAHLVTVIRDAMVRLQAGDLTTRIVGPLPAQYEDLRGTFNTAVEALDDAVLQVAMQCDDMQNQIQDITTATSDIARRTERQAATLRESSEGLEDLTRALTTTEATVQDADGSAKNAQSNATSSEGIVAETASAMEAIESEANEISKIVKVIDEIAFQTNLLALNAGVEAARAGEAGRGFAVVASEVRGLAQRSSENAKNIRELIERSGEQVAVGSAKIEETVASLSQVLAAVFEITSKIAEIAEGAKQQTQGITTLNAKVADLDGTTQQNAAMFEETSAACADLLKGAQTLRDLTQRFQVTSGAPPARLSA